VKSIELSPVRAITRELKNALPHLSARCALALAKSPVTRRVGSKRFARSIPEVDRLLKTQAEEIKSSP